LKWNLPISDIKRSLILFGIKVKLQTEEPAYWRIYPELRSQAELREKHELATRGVSGSTYRASVEKALRALPEHARELIDYLFEDREEASSNERFKRRWCIAALQPKQKPSYGPDGGWIKCSKNTDWLVLIKGETVDGVARKRQGRWEDPWRKPTPRRV
jgi:hypothetical protein